MTEVSKSSENLKDRISTFLKAHKQEMYKVATYASNIFEAVCFILVVKYYENQGYLVKPEGLQKERFRFKFSTRGQPWNYSYFLVYKCNEQGEEIPLFEICHNQKVVGAWFKEEISKYAPLFATDVAVIKAGKLPRKHPKKKGDFSAKNEDLVTFAEVKKLVAYPMLVASFFGIIHELKPEFIQNTEQRLSETFWDEKHLPPILFTSNHLTQGTENVLQSLLQREMYLVVLENVDVSSETQLLEKLAEKADKIISSKAYR